MTDTDTDEERGQAVPTEDASPEPDGASPEPDASPGPDGVTRINGVEIEKDGKWDGGGVREKVTQTFSEPEAASERWKRWDDGGLYTADDPGLIRILIGRRKKKRSRPDAGSASGDGAGDGSGTERKGFRARAGETFRQGVRQGMEKGLETVFPLDHETVGGWIDRYLLPFLKKIFGAVFGTLKKILRALLFKVFPGLETPDPPEGPILWEAQGCFWGRPISFKRYWMNEERIYTDLRLFHVQSDEVLLYKVQDISVGGSWSMGLFGMGTLTVISSDDTHPRLEIKDIKDTGAARKKISDQVKKARDAHHIQVLEFMGRLGVDVRGTTR